MSRFDGSLARTLDFGEAAPPAAPASSGRRIRGLASIRPGSQARVHPARRLGLLRGPDKYAVLDQRRRAAQIKARHAMDLIDVMERAAEMS
jgi:hypothetical protein